MSSFKSTRSGLPLQPPPSSRPPPLKLRIAFLPLNHPIRTALLALTPDNSADQLRMG
jgi:hypothetical protein